MTASRNVRQGMFLSIGGDQVNEAESEIQLDRMRRSSNVVDMQDALQSVQKRRELKAVVIQKSWRKHKLEKVRRQKDNAARCIQKYFRLHAQKTKELLTSKAVMIQRAWKRYTLRANKHLPLAASTIEQSQAPRNAEEEKKERERGDDNGSKRTLAASGETNMAELTPEDAVLDYGPAPSFASKASEDDLNGSHSRLTPGESSSSAEFMIDGVITKVSPELLEIESALFEDVLEGALEDLAKELNVEDMFHQWNVQWNMIQRMFRKKGLVPAIDWLFTYFTRGEAYFWLDILQTHLFPELKMSFKWPDTYGGGFVFSSAGWINAAPLQAARRPERPKPKRGKTDITKLTSMNKGKQGFDLNITSFATQARSQAGNNGRPNESAGTDGHQNHQNATALNENDSQAEPTKTNGMTTPFDSSLASHFTSDEYDEDLEEIGRLVSPFTPSFISSDSPSKTGGFNTHATRPSSVPKASPNGNRPATATSLASTSSGIRLHIAGRTTRPSSRMTTPQQSPLQRGSRNQRNQTASASNSRDFGGKGNLHHHPHPHPHPRNHLTTPRTMTPVHYSRTEEESGGEGEGEGRRRSLRDVDYDRLSLHSAPSLPRSLERRPSPKLRPKWKGHFSDIPPNQLKFLPIEYGGLGPTSRTTSRAMLLEEKRKREKLYKTVNSLNELQLNITNELIDSVIKPDSGW